MNIFGFDIIFVIAAFIILGGGLFVVIYIRPEKRVELLRPRDSRGKVLTVIQETDIGLTCKGVKGVVHRFIKAGRGWTFNVNGKMITKFFGIEGSAYTGLIRGDDIVRVSVPEFLKHTWGPKFYDAIPTQQKQAIETDVEGITIEALRIDEEEAQLPRLRSADVFDEDESIMIRRFAKGVQEKGPVSFVNYVISTGVGALLMYMAIGQGWF